MLQSRDQFLLILRHGVGAGVRGHDGLCLVECVGVDDGKLRFFRRQPFLFVGLPPHDENGKKPVLLCVLCGLPNAADHCPDGILVTVTTLRN